MCRVETPVEIQSPPRKESSGGFEKNRRSVEIGLLALSVIYGVVYHLNPPIQVTDKHCLGQDGDNNLTYCGRPDLVAYKVASACCMILMGCKGIYEWHFSSTLKGFSTSQDRLFQKLPQADLQNVIIFCYQVWDFAVSLTIPEFREPIFLGHHLLAALTAYFSLEHSMVPYYSIYFGGCSEFSSVFLVFADFDEIFVSAPAVKDTFDTFVLACKGLFVLTFTMYRVVGWIKVSISLWSDALQALKNTKNDSMALEKAGFLKAFMALDFVLGALQVYWFGLIVTTLAEMAQGS